jgi:tRNA A37 methylthiotransferase MiaB
MNNRETNSRSKYLLPLLSALFENIALEGDLILGYQQETNEPISN